MLYMSMLRAWNFQGDAADWIIRMQEVHTTTEIFNRGGQNRLTVVGKATATDQRPRLIVALTVAVAQPRRLIC